jgi:hypothetical protein
VCTFGRRGTSRRSAHVETFGADLQTLLDRRGYGSQPDLLRGGNGRNAEGVMREAEQRGLADLFRLRLPPTVTRGFERAVAAGQSQPAGQGCIGR